MVNIPTSLKSGDIIRVTYTDAEDGAYLEGVAGNVDIDATPDAQRMLQKTDVPVGGGSVDFDNYENNADTFAGWIVGLVQRLRSVNPRCYIFFLKKLANGR